MKKVIEFSFIVFSITWFFMIALLSGYIVIDSNSLTLYWIFTVIAGLGIGLLFYKLVHIYAENMKNG